jgi:hypothetical protein
MAQRLPSKPEVVSYAAGVVGAVVPLTGSE